MHAYEIPISCGAGFDRHTITTTKRTLARPGDGARSGSMDVRGVARSKTRNFPRSITVTAAGTKGDTSEELPDVVQHVEPFKTLITRGHLKVIEVQAPAPEAPAELSAPDAPKVESDKPADAGATETTTTPSASKRKREGDR